MFQHCRQTMGFTVPKPQFKPWPGLPKSVVLIGNKDFPTSDGFKYGHPCPSNGHTSGPCPGYVIDHIAPWPVGVRTILPTCNGNRWGRARPKTLGSARGANSPTPEPIKLRQAIPTVPKAASTPARRLKWSLARMGGIQARAVRKLITGMKGCVALISLKRDSAAGFGDARCQIVGHQDFGDAA